MSEYQSSGSLPGAAGTVAGFVADAAFSALRKIATRSARASRAIAFSVMAFVGSTAVAEAETRSLKLHFTHTGERAEVVYKRNGRFDPKGLAQVNRILRDWRRNQSTKMDPRLLDLVWEVYQRSGARDYIHVVSAYRSPATNSMLRGRSRSSGVAKKSQHTLGRAMDFYIPGVKIATLRQLAMQMQVGGVGYYPTSGSPFVHLDVGSVRAWPRMSRQELARIFPSGKTMHLPADGRPLPGYQQAVADYKRRVGSQSIQLASTLADDEEDGGRSAKRGGSGVLTAMLPTPKSRGLAALDEQTSPRAAAAAVAEAVPSARPNEDFADLAKLAAPIPTLRPVAKPDIDTIRTAAIAPAATLAPMPQPAPTPSPAAAPAIALPAPGRMLKEPTRAIALLPITPDFSDEEDDFDSEDALITWALSAPGTHGGMTAPLLVRRALTGVETTGSAEALPVAATREFDTDRFWPRG